MSIRTWLAALSISAAASTGAAHALTLTYDAGVPVTATNFLTPLSFPQFDPSLGTLQSVKITVYGNVLGVASFESFDNQPSTVTGAIQATLGVFRPDNTPLLTIAPTAPFVENLDPFDGVFDRDGTSGRTLDDLVGNASDSITLIDPVDLATFTGLGDIFLPLVGVGSMAITGPGNLETFTQTAATALVQVEYEYMLIPEPMTCALLGVGSVALLRRRRLA